MVINRQNHPYCLWNGAYVGAFDGSGKNAAFEHCKHGNCERSICSYLTAPHKPQNTSWIMSVQVAFGVPPSLVEIPDWVGQDIGWIIVILFLLILTVADIIDVIKICVNGNDIDNYGQARDFVY
jgi:hypothetical protein